MKTNKELQMGREHANQNEEGGLGGHERFVHFPAEEGASCMNGLSGACVRGERSTRV